MFVGSYTIQLDSSSTNQRLGRDGIPCIPVPLGRSYVRDLSTSTFCLPESSAIEESLKIDSLLPATSYIAAHISLPSQSWSCVRTEASTNQHRGSILQLCTEDIVEPQMQTFPPPTAPMLERTSFKYAFMDLPTEIRLDIYRYVFHGVELQTYASTWAKLLQPHSRPRTISSQNPSQDRSLSLLSTNRLVRAEALPILPQEAHLFISMDGITEKTASNSAIAGSHWLFQFRKITWQFEIGGCYQRAVQLNKDLFGGDILECLEWTTANAIV